MRPLYLVFAVFAGCDGMMLGSDAMRGSLADAVGEDQAHLTASRAASSLPSLLIEVDRHAERSRVIMQDMGDQMASMQDCSQIEAMSTLRDGMLNELDAHTAAMHAEADLAAAIADIEVHVGTMTAMLGDMSAMADHTRCGGW